MTPNLNVHELLVLILLFSIIHYFYVIYFNSTTVAYNWTIFLCLVISLHSYFLREFFLTPPKNLYPKFISQIEFLKEKISKFVQKVDVRAEHSRHKQINFIPLRLLPGREGPRV
jgi:hypothetical protein